jgi:hypothetical protein
MMTTAPVGTEVPPPSSSLLLHQNIASVENRNAMYSFEIIPDIFMISL